MTKKTKTGSDRRSSSREESSFLTIGDVADHLAVSTRTVRRWITDGDLAAWKRGNVVRIDPGVFRRFSNEE